MVKKMITWHIEKKKIKDLKAHPKNPRSLSKECKEQIKTSLEKFGTAEKPIINTDGTIIGGHQRIRVLKEMGIKEIDCWMPDHPLDEKQIDELNIRLNLNQGTWNFDVLADSWEPLDLIEWGFSEGQLMGFYENIDNEKKNKEKKLKTCPSCGCEF